MFHGQSLRKSVGTTALRRQSRRSQPTLRLRLLSDSRESLIVTDADSNPIFNRTARADSPESVHFADVVFPANSTLLHSHLNETALSRHDFHALFEYRAYAITAISPGGSLWRAVRGAEPPRRAMQEFALLYYGQKSELALLPEAQRDSIISHSMGIWLEKRGVITYYYRASERNRQVFDRHADLIRSLTDDRPLP